jgi:hypothetical protein
MVLRFTNATLDSYVSRLARSHRKENDMFKKLITTATGGSRVCPACWSGMGGPIDRLQRCQHERYQ